MNTRRQKAYIKLQAKRNVELWVYSFADMYMIMSVFFIALAVIFAAKKKTEVVENERITTAGRGPASVVSDLQLAFDSGSAALADSALEELEMFLPVLKAVRSGRIDIEGYADGSAVREDGDFSSNIDLSAKRAVNVADWLVQNGVAAGKLRVSGFGSGALYSKDRVGTNRRVVVKVSVEGGR